MKHCSLLPFLFLVASCARLGGGPASADTAGAPVPPNLPNGARTYEMACARCHDEGVDGAPRIGDPDSWTGRSQLWDAVLAEHAKQGYLDMPAKGGIGTLDDAAIARAVEHMLIQTFPDSPRD